MQANKRIRSYITYYQMVTGILVRFAVWVGRFDRPVQLT